MKNEKLYGVIIATLMNKLNITKLNITAQDYNKIFVESNTTNLCIGFDTKTDSIVIEIKED